MRKSISRITIAFLLPFFFVVQCEQDLYRGYTEGIEKRSILELSIENDFVKDHVLVIMKTGIDLDKIFGIEDFLEIDCIDVVEGNAGARGLIQKQIRAKESGDWSELQERIDKNRLYDTEHILNLKENFV